MLRAGLLSFKRSEHYDYFIVIFGLLKPSFYGGLLLLEPTLAEPLFHVLWLTRSSRQDDSI